MPYRATNGRNRPTVPERVSIALERTTGPYNGKCSILHDLPGLGDSLAHERSACNYLRLQRIYPLPIGLVYFTIHTILVGLVEYRRCLYVASKRLRDAKKGRSPGPIPHYVGRVYFFGWSHP